MRMKDNHFMTRVNGCNVIATRCCGAKYQTPRYSSINMMAQEYWTDGYRLYSLFGLDGGLRKCVCGKLYLLNQAIKFDASNKGVSEDEKDLSPVLHVEDEDLKNHLQGGGGQELSLEVEVVIRRRYWRFLNHAYRDVYRAVVDGTIESIPACSLSNVQQKNISKLINLLERSDTKEILELVELYRELGFFYNAQLLLKEVDSQSDERLKKLEDELIQAKINAPVRFAY